MRALWRGACFVLCVLLTTTLIVTVFFFLGKAGEAATRAAQKAAYPMQYTELVCAASREYGVPQAVIYAVIRTESGFAADAVSHVGAVGLMQLMPTTYEWLCTVRAQVYDPAALYDPAVNIDAGTYLLSYLYRQFENWETVYAAYNAGIGRVQKWLADPALSRDGVLLEIPISETAEYVRRCRVAKYRYEHVWGL